MKTLPKRGVCCVLAALLVALMTATPALAEGAGDEISIAERLGNAGEIGFDVLVLRPLGVVATAGGFVAFLIAAPFLAPSREVPYGWDSFVIGPYEYTIERPLGDF